jgi:hypothetical protein
MSDAEKQAYNRFIENRRIEMAVTETVREEGIFFIASSMKIHPSPIREYSECGVGGGIPI